MDELERFKMLEREEIELSTQIKADENALADKIKEIESLNIKDEKILGMFNKLKNPMTREELESLLVELNQMMQVREQEVQRLINESEELKKNANSLIGVR